MATNALIVCLKKNKRFDGIPVNFDGYIDDGVGKTLIDYWDKLDDIRKLCAVKKSIRSFGNDFNDIEYYRYSWEDSWEDLKYNRQFKDMDWNSLCNKSGNFDYTYVWYLGKWYLLKNEKRKPLKDLI